MHAPPPAPFASADDIGGFLAATGLQHFARPSDESDLPRNLGGLGDFTSARDLLLGVLGGLFHKQRTGQGTLVDACLLRSGIFSMSAPMTQASRTTNAGIWVAFFQE